MVPSQACSAWGPYDADEPGKSILKKCRVKPCTTFDLCMSFTDSGLCVGGKVYRAWWKVCCWKVCWWQLAMAGLCGVVEWAMEGACVHLVSTSGVLSFALSLENTLVVSDSGNT